MRPVVHFELPANDLERARQFYGSVFGWNLNAFRPDYTIANTTEVDEQFRPKTPGAINGAIAQKTEFLSRTSIVIDVPSIEEYAHKVDAAGGKLIQAKSTIEGMGHYALMEDTEGNLIGLWQSLR